MRAAHVNRLAITDDAAPYASLITGDLVLRTNHPVCGCPSVITLEPTRLSNEAWQQAVWTFAWTWRTHHCSPCWREDN